MNQITVQVGDLSLKSTVELVNELYSLPYAEKYLFDFKSAHSFEPISLLYLSSEIRKCRLRLSESSFSVINYKNCTYAGHMGFFRSFGAEYGNYPGEADGSDKYIPIRLFDAKQIKADASNKMIPVGQHIEIIMKDVTAVLINDTSSIAYGVLAYSLREIFRNVIEHSETDRFGFCAQYWPSKHMASLAILDKGIGIRASLSSNPHLKLDNDVISIKQALLPGISGKMYKGKRNDPYDDWQNSGYGLYMTSEICKKGGSFLIASGNAGLRLESDREEKINLHIDGTLINLTINTTQLTKIEDMLSKLRADLIIKKDSLKPSKASTSFS